MSSLSCPSCKRELPVAHVPAGKQVCPHCQQAVDLVSGRTAAYQPAGEIAPLDATALLDGAIPLDVTMPPQPTALDETAAALRKPADGLLATCQFEPQQEDRASAAQAGDALSAAAHYEVAGEIARGGMGAVLRAVDQDIRREVAVKFLLNQADGEQNARFVEEARITGRLEHPNIVPVHALSVDEKQRVFYTMKFVQGVTLGKALGQLRQGDAEAISTYPLSALLTIFQKVCDAVAFAHSKRVIHRDLKPENIMLGGYGEVLVMDWGLAKILDRSPALKTPLPTTRIPNATLTADATAVSPAPSDSGDDPTSAYRPASALEQLSARDSGDSRTQLGTVLGTPRYMSPEQARGDVELLDERSDIYALGVILYEILSLRTPSAGTGLAEVLSSVITGKIEPLPRTLPALAHLPGRRVPESLAAVVMKALSLSPEMRYATVVELQADITQYQQGFATRAENAGLVKQVSLLIKRNKGVFATAFAAWFIITGLLAWFVINLRTSERETRRQADIAQQNAKKAADEAHRATKAEQSAVASAADAMRERETARRALARSQLDLAEKEFERGKYLEAEKILDETPDNFRDANWRFMQANARDYTAQLTLPELGSAHRVLMLPRGDRFAARFYRDVIGVFTLSGREVAKFPAKGYIFAAFGCDAGGTRLAYAALPGEVAVYDLSAGKLLKQWLTEIDEIAHVALSPDGETVAAVGKGKIIAYTAATGAGLWTKPSKDVAPAFSPDGSLLAILAPAPGLSVQVLLLDVHTGEEQKSLETTADNPTKTTLQFNRAGDRLACIGGDEVILFSVPSGMKERAHHFPGETAVLISPRGNAIASQSGNRIRLWDVESGRLIRSLNGASSSIMDLAFSRDESMLLSTHRAANDALLTAWPVRLNEETAAGRPGYNPRTVCFDADGSRFFAGAQPAAAAWDVRGGSEQWRFATKTPQLLHFAIHPVDRSIVVSESGKSKFTRFTSAGESQDDFGENHYGSLAFNRAGTLLLMVSTGFNQTSPGRTFSVEEYPSGKVLKKIVHDKAGQPYAAFCLGDTVVARGAKAGGIVLWDWQAAQPLRTIGAEETGLIGCFAASPDGQHLATGGPDRWIRIWEAATGKLKSAFRAHWESVRAVKFTPDGREVVSGCEDGTLRIHDWLSGEQRLVVYGYTSPVLDVDISPDGKLIVAVAADGYAKVWSRQASSEAALLPRRTIPPVKKDADGWEHLLSGLTPEMVAETGNGWTLNEGVMLSSNKVVAQPLPGDFAATSYQVRMKLRQVGKVWQTLFLALPVGDGTVGFDLDGWPQLGYRTGISKVEGKVVPDRPGALEGRQINDQEPHDLEATVLLAGPKVTITFKLDAREIYQWTGPASALSLDYVWMAKIPPGKLCLGALSPNWSVWDIKVKRLSDAADNSPPKSDR